MAELKTRPTEDSVRKFLDSVEHEQRRKDAFELLEMMREITGKPGKMWGKSIVGFDTYHYKYKSGREGDWMKVGFSPRKTSMSLYIMTGFDRYEKLLEKLGKHKTGKACLYINKLDDVDREVLKELIQESVDYLDKKYGD